MYVVERAAEGDDGVFAVHERWMVCSTGMGSGDYRLAGWSEGGYCGDGY